MAPACSRILEAKGLGVQIMSEPSAPEVLKAKAKQQTQNMSFCSALDLRQFDIRVVVSIFVLLTRSIHVI